MLDYEVFEAENRRKLSGAYVIPLHNSFHALSRGEGIVWSRCHPAVPSTHAPFNREAELSASV
uniref:Uncharacterized protein n=1 Tax=Pristionchus pacificus TaxID=54126 RepID=A0A2A6CH71_PRIPA|eukprot:PDM77413.1 hypothetical protein PRIPAC_33143 [Pristionchus pacificus]